MKTLSHWRASIIKAVKRLPKSEETKNKSYKKKTRKRRSERKSKASRRNKGILSMKEKNVSRMVRFPKRKKRFEESVGIVRIESVKERIKRKDRRKEWWRKKEISKMNNKKTQALNNLKSCRKTAIMKLKLRLSMRKLASMSEEVWVQNKIVIIWASCLSWNGSTQRQSS